jgi:hypothetical protein
MQSENCAIILLLLLLQLRSNGLNPEVYPSGPGVTEFHAGTAAMGFGNITHAEGFLDALIDTYDYQPAPECSRTNPDCGSEYLWCDVANARCIPINPAFPPPRPTTTTSGTGASTGGGTGGINPTPINPTPVNPIPVAPTTPVVGPQPQTCTHDKPQAYQNSFCINGFCDVSQWVWVPVKIVTQRPPEFTDYKSYPVQNGKIYHTNDIYEPSLYADTSK